MPLQTTADQLTLTVAHFCDFLAWLHSADRDAFTCAARAHRFAALGYVGAVGGAL